MARRAARPETTYPRPRMTVVSVLRRVQLRLFEIQVWDIAATMTFYTLGSVIPAAIVVVSLVSLLGLQQQTLDSLGELVTEIVPSIDPSPYQEALLALARSGGGLVGFVGGLAGVLLSASNAVAALHRSLHRVYGTREGRPFLRFRLVVLGETILALVIVVFAALAVTVGGDWSQRVGEAVGLDRAAFTTWNLVKWPALLVVLILTVSLAYHRFPNVRLPRYRPMTIGSTVSVLVLFVSALVLGRLAGVAARLGDVLPALNSILGILVLVWLGNIVLIAGAALDAEMLRARQLSLGLPAWDRIVLEPRTTSAIDSLEGMAAYAAGISREVAEAIRADEPLVRRGTRWVADASSPLAITASQNSSRKILAAARRGTDLPEHPEPHPPRRPHEESA
ncbi:YihY/virulence factor BrkB family protein [Brachybacterium huguangmaarense]